MKVGPGRVAALVGLGAVGIGVVAAAALEGPARLGPVPVPRVERTVQPPSSAPTPPPVARSGGSDVVSIVLAVLLALVALAVLLLLGRLVRRLLAGPRGRRPVLGPAIATGEPLAALHEEADAPAVRRGIAAALAALASARDPGDAVVAAWLGLQQSAEDAGVARGAAETPTEFARRVLARTGADGRALDDLLALYLRARFAGGAVTPTDAAAAGTALEALQRSWSRARVGAP